MQARIIDDAVPAVFNDEASAEAAIQELRELGFDDNDFGIMVPDPSHYHLMDNTLKDTWKGLGIGSVVGAPLGMLAGISVVSFLIPPLGFVGIGGALVFGGLEGALWGAFVGSQVGLAAQIAHIEDLERRYEIPLRPNEILLVVVAGDETTKVCEIMQKHGARCMWDVVEPAA